MGKLTDLKVRIEHAESKGEDGRVHYKLDRTVSIEGDISDADRAKLQELFSHLRGVGLEAPPPRAR